MSNLFLLTNLIKMTVKESYSSDFYYGVPHELCYLNLNKIQLFYD